MYEPMSALFDPNTFSCLEYLSPSIILFVTDVVTHIGSKGIIQNQEFGGALIVVASNFRVDMPTSNKGKKLGSIFFALIFMKILL